MGSDGCMAIPPVPNANGVGPEGVILLGKVGPLVLLTAPAVADARILDRPEPVPAAP